MARGTPLRGARIVITGAASGLGRRMALGAARRGATVHLWDVSAAGVEALATEIGERGGVAHAHVVDVRDPEAVRAAAARTGGVDVVVNNAGVVSGQRLLDADEAAIRRTFDVNVLGLYWVTRAFLGGMRARRRGTVVTVASAAGLVGVAQQTDYSASKWAAVGFDESLRAELRRDRCRVRTLVVCPYYIDTGMFDGVRTRFPRLLPILDERAVAEQVLDAIEAGKRRLVLPWAVRLVPVGRVLPVAVFDRVMDALGINQTMTHFTGRPGGGADRLDLPAGPDPRDDTARPGPPQSARGDRLI